MKALKSYKTYQEIIADFVAEKITSNIDIDGYVMINRCKENDWGYNEGPSIGFECVENQFCCAFDEIGQFSVGDDDNTGELTEYWPYLLKAFLLRTKPKYLRCSTLNDKWWAPLNDALFEVGFLPCGQVKSNHGNYKVNLWEYYG